MVEETTAKRVETLRMARIVDEIHQRVRVVFVVVELLRRAIEEVLHTCGDLPVGACGGSHRVHRATALRLVLELVLAVGPGIVDVPVASVGHCAHRVLALAGGLVELREDEVAPILLAAGEQRSE